MGKITEHIQNEFMQGEGRIGRMRYFGDIVTLAVFTLLAFILSAVLFKYISLDPYSKSSSIFLIPYLILILGPTTFATILVRNKRFHDICRTGWWQLIIGIPIIGLILELILLFWPGTNGVNKYGYAPLRKSKESNN